MNKQVLSKELFIAVRQTRHTVQKEQHYLEIPQIVNRLAEQIISHTYKPGCYTCFAISDPTPREILAPSYPDRIVHRWLVNKMEPYIDKRFLSCSYANRTGKGHHKAVKQLQYYLNNPANKYYLKMDIESFFNSIDHAVLLTLVKRWIAKLPYEEDEKEIIFSVVETIITYNPTQHVIYTGHKEKLKIIPPGKSYFNNPPGRGLPLGNLSSQFFANIYLHELDWFVKHKLNRITNEIPNPNSEISIYYLRYVDDIVLLAETTEQLKEWKEKISNFLKEELKLNPHPKKTILQPTHYGIDFLGYVVKRNYILVRRRVVKNFKRKLYFYNHLLEPEKYPFRQINGNGSIEKMCGNKSIASCRCNAFAGSDIFPEKKLLASMQSSLNSYYGIFRFADTYHLRKDLYINRFGNLKKMFYVTGNFQKASLMKVKNKNNV